MTPKELSYFPETWASETFGKGHAAEIAWLVTEYSEYAARRKPELVDQNTYSLGEASKHWLDGGEFGEIVTAWRELAQRSETVRAKLRPDQQSAYFQLVHFPILAVSNLYEMYYAAAWNKLLASRNDARANYFADEVERTFARDTALTAEYHSINGGKWDGMMSQVHMRYVIWNDPTKQSMPSITRVAGDMPAHLRNARPVFRNVRSDDILFDAGKFSRVFGSAGLSWKHVPDLGLRDGALVSYPQGRPATAPENNVRAEYDFTTRSAGDLTANLRLLPTLNTNGTAPLRVGASLDDGPIQVLSYALTATGGAQNTKEEKAWAAAVINNSLTLQAGFPNVSRGKHVLKIWRIDDNVVLDEIRVQQAQAQAR